MKEAPGARRGGTVLAFDFGARRIGVAVGEADLGTASALATLRGDCPGPDWPAIDALIAEWRPSVLVVGRPMRGTGEPSETTAAAERFARQLAARQGAPVELVDERLSSVAAASALRDERRSGTRRRRLRPGDIDRAAARIILQTWLDTRGHEAR